jgi:cytochrome c oxidase assembly factor CtaG
MAQHGLLVAVAPPLLLMGQPGAAFAWALPSGWSRGRMSAAWRPIARLGRALSLPFPAAVLHGLALWIWHAPGLFDAAVEREWLHTLEHVSFFGTALLFWRAVIRAAAGREAAAGGLVACFVTLLQSGILSALLSFAREPLFRTTDAAAWGLTALEDQQLAGAIMSVPMGIVYLGAGLAMAARLLTPPTAEQAKASVVSSPPVPKPSR